MALRFSHLLIFCTCWMIACSQSSSYNLIIPTTDILTYQLGNTSVRLTLRTYHSPSRLFFIHLHDNESTAEKAAIALLEQYGGQLLSIDNKEQRNIRFQFKEHYFTIDPNRIFSDSGITATLRLLSQADTAAQREVKAFAQFILSKIPDTALVVAVHNNTDNNFSVRSYQTTPLNKEASVVYVNPDIDADDFILTTDSLLFQHYKEKKISAVLQQRELLPDDGSLSIFLGKKNRNYINIEAEHKHAMQQRLLLQHLFDFLQLSKKLCTENK